MISHRKIVYFWHFLYDIFKSDIKQFPSNKVSCRCVRRWEGTHFWYRTGTTPASCLAMLLKTGMGKSKCCLGGSHHPPLDPGGQKFVAVITTVLEKE